MALVIALREKTSIPVEVDSIQLDQVRQQSADQIKSTLVQYGNKQVELGQFFDVSGSASDDNQLVWEGDCSHVKMIGANLTEGSIRVEGNAGMHLGVHMSGGTVEVQGNSGDWTGAEMSGGRIIVHGNAGHLLGAVYRGGRRGMTGGEILVHGDAGNEIAHTMRRGLIAVGGRAGDGAGIAMLAGSLFLFGETGIRPGAGMRRGTIGLFGNTPATRLLPTFKYATTYQPVFLQFYFRHLEGLKFPLPDGCSSTSYDRYCGDFLESGKGEILVRTLEA